MVTPTAHFATTRWSIVLASRDPASDGFADAMSELAHAYAPAIRVFLAACGAPRDELDDLTQEFFVSWTARGMPRVDPNRGSFRAYLKGALRHFVHNHRRARRRDRDALGHAQALAPGVAATAGDPESAFDDAFRAQLLGAAVRAMCAEYDAEDRSHYADAFRRYYLEPPTDAPITYGSLARTLDVCVSDVTNWLAHGRRRLRHHVARLVRDSVRDEAAYRREMEALRGTRPGDAWTND